uniref:CSON014446 protein n=1 Tax=Culicoides sonorensis TaxID=179676 RepID=A0A336LHV0_CULSO
MSSFSMSKLKNLLPTKTSYSNFAANSTRKTNENEKLEPEVGFRLELDSGKAKNSKEKDRPPELIVHLIGARHLPTSFGLKSVKGYVVKVKLFPGSIRHESSIQTASWPKFNDTFSFPMGPVLKSSMKQKQTKTEIGDVNLPERLFNGHFIVFTVFALLELPPGAQNKIQEALTEFKRQGSLLLRQRPASLMKGNSVSEEDEVKVKGGKGDKSAKEAKIKHDSDIPKEKILTASESQRNIGSVTWSIEPKLFVGDAKKDHFVTEEMWKSIKELTINHVNESRMSVQSSVRGQLELILELCEIEPPSPLTPNPPGNPFDCDANSDDVKSPKTPSNTRSFSFKGVKSIMKLTKKPKNRSLYLKVITSRMRCSIKAKEEFEKSASDMYIKTSVFKFNDIPLKAWKSENFAPTLSSRWDPNEATISIPIDDESDLENINIRISVATKNKMGKKLVFGEINLGPKASGSLLEHWGNMISNRGNPVAMWHNFQ